MSTSDTMLIPVLVQTNLSYVPVTVSGQHQVEWKAQ